MRKGKDEEAKDRGREGRMEKEEKGTGNEKEKKRGKEKWRIN